MKNLSLITLCLFAFFVQAQINPKKCYETVTNKNTYLRLGTNKLKKEHTFSTLAIAKTDENIIKINLKIFDSYWAEFFAQTNLYKNQIGYYTNEIAYFGKEETPKSLTPFVCVKILSDSSIAVLVYNFVFENEKRISSLELESISSYYSKDRARVETDKKVSYLEQMQPLDKDIKNYVTNQIKDVVAKKETENLKVFTRNMSKMIEAIDYDANEKTKAQSYLQKIYAIEGTIELKKIYALSTDFAIVKDENSIPKWKYLKYAVMLKEKKTNSCELKMVYLGYSYQGGGSYNSKLQIITTEVSSFWNHYIDLVYKNDNSEISKYEWSMKKQLGERSQDKGELLDCMEIK